VLKGSYEGAIINNNNNLSANKNNSRSIDASNTNQLAGVASILALLFF